MKKKLFEVRFKAKNEICFEVDNYEEVDAMDIMALHHFKDALASAGAIPTKVDVPEKIFCMEITYPELSVQEILNLFAKFGYRVRLKEN